MKYHINSKSKNSSYIQLYEMIRDDIISGVYQYGDKLPSKRTIADDGEISVITVAHAYELLIDEGYVEAKEKSGYYVIYRTGDFYQISEENNSVNNHRNVENPFVSSGIQRPYVHGAGELSYNVLAKTMRRALLDYGEKILERSPNSGIEELRYEISKYLARNVGIHADWSQIIIGAGAEYLYGLVAQLLSDCETFAIEKPSYEKIKKVYEGAGIRVEELELGADGIQSSDLAASTAKVLHVTPFHSYPSNVSASISKKNEYLDWAKNGKYIIEDNYDSELTVSKKMDHPVYALSKQENVIYINTFSKTIAPSLRVGYMVLPKSLVALFNEKLGFYSCTVPTFEQFVLCELIKNGDFERHINKVRRKLRQMNRNK